MEPKQASLQHHRIWIWDETRIMSLHLLVQNPNSSPLSLSQTQVKVFNTDTLLKETKIGPKG